MLRKALIDLQSETRMYTHVKKDYGDFVYICEGSGAIDMLEGQEEITVDAERVYYFYYAGGYIG